LIVSPSVEPKSHAYVSYTGPFGVTVPARHLTASVVPQRHGTSCKLTAHFDEKTLPIVSRHACVSVSVGDENTGGPASETVAQLRPSGKVPPNGATDPGTASHVPPVWVESRQPFAIAHDKQLSAGGEVGLSCASRQSCVLPVIEQAPTMLRHVLSGAHACPGAHVPHWSVPPQPSGAVPHCWPGGQPFGTQHTPALLQIAGAAQDPQSISLPQPSGYDPHVAL
jgi:hypothetical protein